jgi:hypothetical protein
MATNVTQIKVTLPDPLMDYLASRAGKFGLTLSAYVKHLIVNDVKDMEFPTYQMSEKTEGVMLKAIEEDKLGKTKVMDNVDKFIDDL